MHLLFGIPSAGGAVKTASAVTLFRTAIAVKEAGWSAEILSFDSSSVVAARNYFANTVVRQRRFTHLVMIDSDMYIEGHIICRLLRSRNLVVAGAYSQRSIDLRAFAQTACIPGLEPADLAALSMQYNLNVEFEPETRQVKVIDGMCRVSRIAMGCAVISRTALETLIEAGIVRLRPDALLQKIGMEGSVYDFFGQIELDNGDYLSEDYSFCDRWLSISGNEIWALVDEPIGHVGDMIFSAPFVNRLLHGKA